LSSSVSENLIFWPDETGDLALLDVSYTLPYKIWSAGTSGSSAVATVDNGSLVVYDSSDANASVLWKTDTVEGEKAQSSWKLTPSATAIYYSCFG